MMAEKMLKQFSKIEDILKRKNKMETEKISEMSGIDYWVALSRLNSMFEMGKAKKEIREGKIFWRINGR